MNGDSVLNSIGESRPAEAHDQLLRVAEVATALGISVRQVWKLTSLERLPTPIKIGGSTRWRASDLARVIREGTKRGLFQGGH